MALTQISLQTAPRFAALSTDIVSNKITGASYTGALVFITDTKLWYIINSDQTLSLYNDPTLFITGQSAVSQNPVAVTQSPKASYQTMKTFTGTIATNTSTTTVQSLYTVTAGKTFYVTDISYTNATNNACLVTVNASSSANTSPIDTGHAISTAPYIKTNIGTEPSVAGGTPVTAQAGATIGITTIAFTISGYEQ